jgi:hypothetical protein
MGNISNIAKDTHKGDVIHLPPAELSWENRENNADLVAVVFPNYLANQDLQIYQLDKTQGFMQLVENAFNYGVLREVGFKTLTNVIDSVETF